MDEMLDAIPADMFAEWYAYERYAGPVDSRWRDDVQGGIQEKLQGLMHLTAAVNTGKKKKNPVPEPQHLPRPWELYDDEESEDDEED